MSRSEINRRYREKNLKKISIQQAKWKAENAEHCRNYGRKWSAENKDKIAAKNKRYLKAKPEANREKSRRYLAAKLKRFPVWADREKIKAIYNACPKGMQVDHVIPMRGKMVSGLHVAENLQYLTPRENQKKYNKY